MRIYVCRNPEDCPPGYEQFTDLLALRRRLSDDFDNIEEIYFQDSIQAGRYRSEFGLTSCYSVAHHVRRRAHDLCGSQRSRTIPRMFVDSGHNQRHDIESLISQLGKTLKTYNGSWR